MAATSFQWNNGDKIKKLIRCLANYKSKMDYQNSDFNADKVKQYEAVREAIARMYEEEPTFFLLSFVLHQLVSCHHPKKLELTANKRLNCERSNAPIFTSRIFDAILISVPSSRQISNLAYGLKFQPGLAGRAEIRHVIATKFQPAYRDEISARAEIRHVISPLHLFT